MSATSQPKSFNDILRYHTSFLVNPLLWTSHHLDLVGCRFEDVGTTHVYAESPQNDQRNNDHPKPCQNTASDAEGLARNISPPAKRDHLINILVGKERPFSFFSIKGAPFYFQGRFIHRPNYIMFHRRNEPAEHIHNSPPPLVGYVHYTSVNGSRGRRFMACPGPRGTLNHIVGRIYNKRLAQITPKEWTEDPYFICHLLALAQLQERKLNLPKPTTYISRLLVTHIFEREYMLLYEAQITTELLNGLRNPKDATSPMEWPIIRRMKIPYKPYVTFADRLAAELVAPGPLASRDLSNPSDDMNDSNEHSMKRPHEKEDAERLVAEGVEPSSLPYRDLPNTSNDVNDVNEHNMKRSHEQEDYGPCKTRRI